MNAVMQYYSDDVFLTRWQQGLRKLHITYALCFYAFLNSLRDIRHRQTYSGNVCFCPSIWYPFFFLNNSANLSMSNFPPSNVTGINLKAKKNCLSNLLLYVPVIFLLCLFSTCYWRVLGFLSVLPLDLGRFPQACGP